MVESVQRQLSSLVLTEEGRSIADEGSHEVRVFNAVHPTAGALQSDIMVRVH